MFLCPGCGACDVCTAAVCRDPLQHEGGRHPVLYARLARQAALPQDGAWNHSPTVTRSPPRRQTPAETAEGEGTSLSDSDTDT